MTNILEKIIEDKKETLKLLKKDQSQSEIEKKIKNLNFFFLVSANDCFFSSIIFSKIFVIN